MTTRPAARPANRKPLALRVWRNPLARGADRAEVLLSVGLIIIWLLTLPLFATVGSAVWTTVQSRVVADQRDDVAVDAVVRSDASLAGDTATPSVAQPKAPATWLGRNGLPADGLVTVQAGARAGDHVTVWLDADGSVVNRPMSTQTAAGLLVAAAAGAWLVLGLLFLGLWRVTRHTLDQRRWRLWSQEWESFDAGRNRG